MPWLTRKFSAAIWITSKLHGYHHQVLKEKWHSTQQLHSTVAHTGWKKPLKQLQSTNGIHHQHKSLPCYLFLMMLHNSRTFNDTRIFRFLLYFTRKRERDMESESRMRKNDPMVEFVYIYIHRLLFRQVFHIFNERKGKQNQPNNGNKTHTHDNSFDNFSHFSICIRNSHSHSHRAFLKHILKFIMYIWTEWIFVLLQQFFFG